jgi:glycosyltransferase involved in cell wall biosynthesis
LRIHFCMPRYHTNLAPWVRILKSHGHQVTITVASVGFTENYSDISPVKFVPSRSSKILTKTLGEHRPNQFYSFPKFSEIIKEIDSIKPDLVVVRDLSRPWTMLIIMACIIRRIRFCAYDQNSFVNRDLRTLNRVRRSVFRAFSLPQITVVPANECAQREVRIQVVPFGAPLNIDELSVLRKRRRPVDKRQVRLLMVGKFRSRKGHVALLEALRGLQDLSSLHLTICGECRTEQEIVLYKFILDKIQEFGLQNQVEFKLNISPDLMPDIYLSADVFILPAYGEPAAVSPMEAVWFGCASIISGDCGTRGYLPPSPKYEVDPFDTADIRAKIEFFISDVERIIDAQRECLEHLIAIASDEVVLRGFNQIIVNATDRCDN